MDAVGLISLDPAILTTDPDSKPTQSLVEEKAQISKAADNLREAIDYKITTASEDIPLETMKDLTEKKEKLSETLDSISKSQVPQLKESDINPFQTMDVENLLSFDPNFADQAPNVLQDLLEEHPTVEPYQEEPQLDQVLADMIYAFDDKINLSTADDSTDTARDALLQKRDKLQEKLDLLVKDNGKNAQLQMTISSRKMVLER